MMLLVLAFDIVQHGERLFGRRLLDDNLLETAFERSVGFDILPEFAQRRRSDALQLAPGKYRFQDIRRVERALRAARTDDRMNLVDEQDHVVGFAQFAQQRVDPLLEFAAVLRSGYQRRHVQGKNPFIAQCNGHVVIHDPEGEPFDDRRFAYARFADQYGIVLLAAAQNLHEPLYLFIPADHRIETPFPGRKRQVHPKTDQRVGRRRLALFAHWHCRFAFGLRLRAGLKLCKIVLGLPVGAHLVEDLHVLVIIFR